MDTFAARLLDWYDREGRKDLPWQRPRTPYRVWLSEVMLQQTQVATVVPYFERFVARFPDVSALARASLDEVLALWTGLGYYARARNLHAAARTLEAEYDGELPADAGALVALPGIGRSTAGAILACAFGIRAPILDGNVRRVLARHHAVPGFPGAPQVARTLWSLADEHTPAARVADYTQAIMDLGALVCRRTKPDCERCPVSADCAARLSDRVGEFPAPRPRRTMPTRMARMFVVIDPEGRCLLERRPTSGFWGGLWTPPERDATTPLEALLAEIGCDARNTIVETLPPFRHTFTHFHLDIEPVRARVSDGAFSIADGERYRWWSARDNEPIGLAAPAVKLLRGLSP
jgi:A/G-specific adenine glycosylase